MLNFVKDIFGHIVEFSGDQNGSRLIQQQLEDASEEDRERVFKEILSNISQLIQDVFGNYVSDLAILPFLVM